MVKELRTERLITVILDPPLPEEDAAGAAELIAKNKQ